MKLSIAGSGWVTPLGTGLAQVWDCLIAGKRAQPETISDQVADKVYPALRVPAEVIQNLPTHPRLRRASNISRFAAGAGLAALDQAGVTNNKRFAERTALVFAIANGGVIYTKRFYHEIVASGADAASPLLFPETVFNAAASHLAAILGITGATYTVVGDGAVGLIALKMAQDLMADPRLDYCLVVAAEEADWLLCDAYRKWRLLGSTFPIEPFHRPAAGAILSEGAGAVLLARDGSIRLEKISLAGHYSKRKHAAQALTNAFKATVPQGAGVVIASANGTFIDAAEMSAFSDVLTEGIAYAPKRSLGESVAAGAVWQVLIAAQVLQRKQLPRPWLRVRTGNLDTGGSVDLADCRRIAVTTCGLNQQAGALELSI